MSKPNRIHPATCDIIVIGGGAAGLTAAIYCKQQQPDVSVVILDGAKKLGAKIRVAGGGRCNVTHQSVSPDDFAGSSPNAIKKVLKQLSVAKTIEWFNHMGVLLTTEASGKLFPVSNKAADVVAGLVTEAVRLGVQIHCQQRVNQVIFSAEHVQVETAIKHWQAQAIILATGGKSLPKTGSDGYAYRFAKAAGHQITPKVTPALVPLLATDLNELAGLSHPVNLWLQAPSGKLVAATAGSLLCTHFGFSGPVILDISRYLLQGSRDWQLFINWLGCQHHFQRLDEFSPGREKHQVTEQFDTALLTGRARQVDTVIKQFSQQRNETGEPLPQRLINLIGDQLQLDSRLACQQLSRVQRRQWVQALTNYPVDIIGDRGYTYAEVTAGGVPLSEMTLATLQSRFQPRLFLCGEICDVDGRIGGFNFQWAWASGYVAGRGAARFVSHPVVKN